MTEKKNEIFIRKHSITNGTAYWVNYYPSTDIDESKKDYNRLHEGDFYEVLSLLINTSNNFYKNGIKLEFEKNPIIKIPQKEKQTIEKLVRKLEKDAKEIKDLKYTIKMINTLSKDREFHSKYKIIKKIVF